MAIPTGMPQSRTAALDVEAIRTDFPILERTVRDGQPLVYLDCGAHLAEAAPGARRRARALRAAQRRRAPGAHQLARRPPTAYEGARRQGRRVHRRAVADEVVFTKNATEAINLVAYAFGNAATAVGRAARFAVGPGDEIVVTEMEHHANLVPWQQLCAAHRRDAALVRPHRRRPARPADLDELINERTKVVALVHLSNILGTVNPVAAIAARAREVGALVVLDACQSVPHMPVDVAALGADFVAFTGHKMLGPTGIGVLWGRARAARRAAAVPHRRLDDRDRDAWSGSTFAAAAAAVRGRHPADRRRRSGSARPSTT